MHIAHALTDDLGGELPALLRGRAGIADAGLALEAAVEPDRHLQLVGPRACRRRRTRVRGPSPAASTATPLKSAVTSGVR